MFLVHLRRRDRLLPRRIPFHRRHIHYFWSIWQALRRLGVCTHSSCPWENAALNIQYLPEWHNTTAESPRSSPTPLNSTRYHLSLVCLTLNNGSCRRRNRVEAPHYHYWNPFMRVRVALTPGCWGEASLKLLLARTWGGGLMNSSSYWLYHLFASCLTKPWGWPCGLTLDAI